MPRDAGDGRLPAFKERQDHGAVDNDQLKVFSEATVRKAADVRHAQQRYQRAPIDNPQFAVLYAVRQASNMVECRTARSVTISGRPFGQEVSERLFPFFGCFCHSLEKDWRAFYWRRPAGTMNFPLPRLFRIPSPLHNKRIVSWVKLFTHALSRSPVALWLAVVIQM
jgi:hypothetical protein